MNSWQEQHEGVMGGRRTAVRRGVERNKNGKIEGERDRQRDEQTKETNEAQS